MNKLVEFGAPEEVAYVSKHTSAQTKSALLFLVTDCLRENKHEIRYNARVSSLIYETNKVVGVKLDSGEELLSDHVIWPRT